MKNIKLINLVKNNFKKIFVLSLFCLMFFGIALDVGAVSVTRYINKTCLSDCDGTTEDRGYVNITEALSDPDIGDGDGDTLEFVENSGPYYDIIVLNSEEDSINFKGNGCSIHGDVEITSKIDVINYNWLPSENAIYDGWYYFTKKNCAFIEMISNGSFDNAMQGWSTINILEQKEGIYDSVRNEKVLHLVEAESGAFVYQTITLEAKDYAWAVDIKGDDGTFFIDLYKTGGGESYILVDESIAVVSGWVERSGDITITQAGDYFIRVMPGVSRAFDISIDDISVREQLETPIPVCQPSDIIIGTPDSVEFTNSSSKPEDWSWFASAHTLFHPTGANNPPDDLDNDGYSNYDGFLGELDRHNWAYGDKDSLGFNTLYVYLSGENKNPNNLSDLEVWVANRDTLITIELGSTGHSFENIILKGANSFLIKSDESFTGDHLRFENTDEHAIYSRAGNLDISYSKFINTGHRAFVIYNDNSISERIINFKNNYIFGSHLWFINRDPSGSTFNIKNNSSESMCYGISFLGDLTGLILNQTYNQYSLDPVCHNGGKIGSECVGIWDNTAINEIPSSISTTASCGVSGQTACGTSVVDSEGLHKNSFSLNIDSGTDVGLTNDYDGNSIYGIPDIGAYEYQPPYTIGTHDIPTTGSIRIYSDGKYRMKTASSTSATTTFSITPTSGSYQSTTTQYMDITIDSWLTTGTQNKQWTATSTSGDFLTQATSTIYTIGDLKINTYYQFKLDGTASTTAITNDSVCADGVCKSDADGQIIFTYVGGYSTHTFGLEEGDNTAPIRSAGSPNSALSTNTTQTTLSLTTNETATCKYSTTASTDYNSMTAFLTTNNTTHSTTITGLTNNTNYNYYVKCQDTIGNTNSSDYTISFSVKATAGGGIPIWLLNQTNQNQDNTTDNNQDKNTGNNNSDKTIIEQIKQKVFSYSRSRLKSLFQEQDSAKDLKSELEKYYGENKIPVHKKHWHTIVNSYIYGNYPIQAIIQAIKFGGKTVHPTIPFSAWQKAGDYLGWIGR